MKLPKNIQGECHAVVHCLGALKSLQVALKSVTPAKKQKSMTAALLLQLERLASGKRMAGGSMRKEGQLPSYQGKPAKNFWAIKRIPIRGYFWESDRREMTYFLSHYIYKDFDELHDSDVKKVCNNWDRIERGCDEC